MTHTQIKTTGEDSNHTMTYAVTVEHEDIVYSDIVAVDSWAAEKRAIKLHYDLTGREATFAYARVQRRRNDRKIRKLRRLCNPPGQSETRQTRILGN